ncbi:YIP1 family protein [Listeria booriae]|uniref:YIP1 family protein n=1 Tax=Listeria booriae TaxID=1552123 RepID=UPI0016296B8E|nr:YIP1 family protein [Listeria booriae]MBC2104985.1 hypothetical protein [Listeria booriae]
MGNYLKYAILLMFVSLVLWPAPVVHGETAYKTYTSSVDGDLIEIQTAYEAFDMITNAEIGKLEDILIDGNRLYLVDSDAKRVLVTDLDGNVERSFGEQVLGKPTGIARDANGDVYVADSVKEKVFRFSENGVLIRDYGRPVEPFFGKREPFKPVKLSVDVRGNLYIIGEGASNGVIQLNKDGDFLGYYGANMAETTFFQKFKDAVMSDAQKAKTLMNVPAASTNIDIDANGIVYTVTASGQAGAIKKLNIAGQNMLAAEAMFQPADAIDIVAGTQNNFYVLTSGGRILEYDSSGNLLFAFGSKESNAQRMGIYKDPTALAVDADGMLYVTDSEARIVHKLQTTAFANEVHQGLMLFEDGRYVESEDYWREVLKLNSSFVLARVAMGEAYYKQEQYAEAKTTFLMAKNKPGYSDAFWELRQQWLERNLAGWLFAFLIGLVAFFVLRSWHRKKGIFAKPIAYLGKWKQVKLIRELGLLFKVFRHPIDTFYEIKCMGQASVVSASIWYGVLIAEFILFQYQVGFIFNSELVERVSIFLLVILLMAVLALFVVMNYLISTINEGEGSFRNVYIATIYALAPFIVLIVPIILVSNVLTINEGFIYSFSLGIAIWWSVIYLIIMVREIHNFTFWETAKNILLTVFASLITVAVGYILFLLFNQLYEFVYSILQEVLARV